MKVRTATSAKRPIAKSPDIPIKKQKLSSKAIKAINVSYNNRRSEINITHMTRLCELQEKVQVELSIKAGSTFIKFRTDSNDPNSCISIWSGLWNLPSEYFEESGQTVFICVDSIDKELSSNIPKRPSMLFTPHSWKQFATTTTLNLSKTKFFKSLLSNRIVKAQSIHELPITEPRIGCITIYTDPTTKVQVVCLPQSLPNSTMIGSHIVFVRLFNVAIMKAMVRCLASRIVVIGNAGIGKSYMQLMILIWWTRQDLRPPGLNEFFDQIHVIARLERGHQTDLFFKNDKRHYVIDSTNNLPALGPLDSKSTLLLYEPCVSKDEIQICGLTASRVWATVSPLRSRYKEFSKTNAALRYMECASEKELLFMAAVLEQGFNASSLSKALLQPDSVRTRIRTLGPFHRAVLPTIADSLTVEMKNYQSALSNLTSELLLKAWNVAENGSAGGLSISHHILRILPTGIEFDDFNLMAASSQISGKLGELLYDTNLSDMKHMLVQYNETPGSPSISPAIKGSISTVLESFFAKNAGTKNNRGKFSGWEVAVSKFSINPDGKNWKPTWNSFSMNVKKVEKLKSPTYQQMINSPGTLFWMNDTNYPFVDFFKYDSATNAVHAFQLSKSESGHPKSVKTFNSMIKKAQIPPDIGLVIFIVPLPRQVDGYVSGGRSMPFKGVLKNQGKIDKIGKEVSFRVVKMALRHVV
ncbi:hypothetical protein BDR26DRAFT_872742 [Obelidium mucronatum]|nr:hypothetical protein BDR26DRAFT_872742 [Obelidium mucronatum]